jgi:hypothetical protein
LTAAVQQVNKSVRLVTETGKMRRPMSPTSALFGMPPRAMTGPVLKFKRRDDAQFLDRPRQVAGEEAASGAPL